MQEKRIDELKEKLTKNILSTEMTEIEIKPHVLEKGLEKNRKINEELNLLHPSLEKIMLLCLSNSCLDKVNPDTNKTVLMYAADKKHWEVVEFFLKNYSDKAKKNQLDFLFKHLVINNKYDLAKLLLKKRPNTQNYFWDYYSANFDSSSLHFVISEENPDFELIKLMCQNNTTIGHGRFYPDGDYDDTTILSFAAERNQWTIVNYFLENHLAHFTIGEVNSVYNMAKKEKQLLPLDCVIKQFYNNFVNNKREIAEKIIKSHIDKSATISDVVNLRQKLISFKDQQEFAYFAKKRSDPSKISKLFLSIMQQISKKIILLAKQNQNASAESKNAKSTSIKVGFFVGYRTQSSIEYTDLDKNAEAKKTAQPLSFR